MYRKLQIINKMSEKTTSQLVQELLERELYIFELLKEDLLNVSALARKFLPSIKKQNPKATIESIIISIQRCIEHHKEQNITKNTRKIISSCQLTTRNDVAHITYKRNEQTLQELSQIAKKIQWDQEEIFFVNQGSGEVTIIIDEKNYDKISKRGTIEETHNLALISVKETLQDHLPPSIEVPGIYSYFISRLSQSSVNILEIISTYSQLTFIIRGEDLLRSHELLQDAIAYFRTQQ